MLIATDLLARGIDVQHVSVVCNMDLPRDRENYIHRSDDMHANSSSYKACVAIKSIPRLYSWQLACVREYYIHRCDHDVHANSSIFW